MEEKKHYFCKHRESPDYIAAVRNANEVNPTWIEPVRFACASHALKTENLLELLNLYSTENRSDELSRREIKILLKAAQKLVILGIDGENENGPSIIAQIVLVATEYIGTHPRALDVRRHLDQLLSTSHSGKRGLITILYAVILLEDGPLQIIDTQPHQPSPIEELSKKEAEINRALDWLSERQPCVLGRVVLPQDLVIEPVDSFLEQLIAQFESFSFSIADNSDVVFFKQMLLLGVSMANYCSDRDIDLKLMRLAGGKFVLSGQGQFARNLAEQTLEMSQGTKERMRKGWTVVADIYQRMGSEVDCFAALCCALSIKCEIDLQQAVLERGILVCALRQLGFLELAKEKLSKIRQTIATFPLNHQESARLDFMATQLNVLDAVRKLDSNPEMLVAAIEEDLVKSAHRAIAEHDDVLPIAILFAQAVKWAERGNIGISDAAKNLCESLFSELGTREARLVRAISSKVPTTSDLLQLASQQEDALYAEDLAFDCQHLLVAAKELLSSDTIFLDPEAAIVACEILAERSVNSADDDQTYRRALSNQTLQTSAPIAKSISRNDVHVLLAALDADDCGVTVLISDGQIRKPIRHSVELFSGAAVRKWSKDFPREYGNAAPDDDVFFTSTEAMKLEQVWEADTLKAIVVSDAKLQEIPPNLIRFGDSFAGSGIAIGAAPSLSWLQSEIQRVPSYTSRLNAWISTGYEDTKPLNILSERIGDVLNRYSVDLFAQSSVPDNLKYSDLVIVSAHGGFDERSGIFQRLRDDHELLVEPKELAQALEDVRIVVLFVCHAGRLDTQITGHATEGLVKQLLNQRCSTILASPWSLDVAVAQIWLPAFLSALSAGNAAIDANFAANQSVARHYPFDFNKTLAMNLYGNPFTKLPCLSPSDPK